MEVDVVDDGGLTLDDLVGAWEMEWVETTTADGTTTVTRPPEISGVITYTPDGHMCAFFLSDHSIDGFPFAAYAATVSFEDGRVVHRVLLGTPPTDAGTTQLRDGVLDRATGALTLSGQVGTARKTLRWRRLPPHASS